MKLPVYNILLDGAEGITKMSLVDYPAVESDFLAFGKEQPLKFSIDEDQHIVFGVALRADFPIYRRDERGEYYVIFTKDVINQLYQKFLKEDKLSAVNLDHNTDTKGVYLIQSFIKDESNGIAPLGFSEIKDGSWFVAYKVENEDVWKQVKEGTFRGFSVEGSFVLEPQKEPSIDDIINEMLENQ